MLSKFPFLHGASFPHFPFLQHDRQKKNPSFPDCLYSSFANRVFAELDSFIYGILLQELSISLSSQAVLPTRASM